MFGFNCFVLSTKGLNDYISFFPDVGLGAPFFFSISLSLSEQKKVVIYNLRFIAKMV